MRIEVIGNIASGKTTLTHALSEEMAGVFEDFKSNPFWESFYKNPELNAFETEITFTLQHYHAIKSNRGGNTPFACDFSLLLDKAYADVTLSGRRLELYSNILQELVGEVRLPEYLVHLTCPEEELLKRIRARNRSVESTITIDYLKSLTKQIDEVVKEKSMSFEIIELDSGLLDFANSRKERKRALDIVWENVKLG